MSASPYAAVIFIVIGVIMFGAGFTHPTLLAIYFLGFAIVWLAGSYAFDWIRFRGKD